MVGFSADLECQEWGRHEDSFLLKSKLIESNRNFRNVSASLGFILNIGIMAFQTALPEYH